MDATERLLLVVRPEDVGLTTEDNLKGLMAELQADAALRTDATAEQQYQQVLAALLSMQLRKVLREPRSRRLGDVDDTYDTVRIIPQLRRDIRAALLAAGLAQTGIFAQKTITYPVRSVL